MKVSRWATVGLCVAGVGFAAIVPNINAIWGLITMGLGAGLFVPLWLRWYWPRFNGYGFAAGTGGGIIAALIFDAALKWPLYQKFPAIVGVAFVGAVLVTLVTQPVPEKVLMRFSVQVNPWGLWGRIGDKAEAAGLIDKEGRSAQLWERMNDVVALFFAVPFQVCLLLGGMSFVFHDWGKFSFFAVMTVFCGAGLYFFWFPTLKSHAACEKDEADMAKLREFSPMAGEQQ